MIIRILGEGQYLLDDKLVEGINEIDNKIVRDLKSGNQGDFSRDISELIASVKSMAKPLDPTEILLRTSSFLPPTSPSRKQSWYSAERA